MILGSIAVVIETFLFTKIQNKALIIDNIDKVNIVLNLLHTLRNRACHFENLLKIRENDNKLYPRISTKEKGTNIGLMPDKIENFLNDLICLINKDLLDYLNRG